jgi:hypothetical protein
MTKVVRMLEALEGVYAKGTAPFLDMAPFRRLSSPPDDSSASYFAPLVRKLVETRQRLSAGAVFTFVAPRSGDGVTYVVRSFARVLARHTTDPILVATLQGVNNLQKLDLPDFRRRFGFVLIDCPAMNASSDFAKLSRVADGFVLVILAGRTNRSEIECAQQTLAAQSANILGLVLNRREPALPPLLSALL